MDCQYHINKPCTECDIYLSPCSKCAHIDCEGDCNNNDSKHYGECVEDLTLCCCLFEKFSGNINRE